MDSQSILWEIKTASSFHEVAGLWDELNINNNNQSVLSSPFIIALLEHFSNKQELVVLGWKDKRLCFAGIFEPISKVRWRTFQPSQAPLGCMLCCPGLLSFELLSAISQMLPSKPIFLDITQMDSARFPLPLAKDLFTIPYINTGSMEVPQDFYAYFSGLSKNARQNSNKARNRLAKADIETQLEIITKSERMENYVGIYGDIESSGWKNAGATAVSRDNSQGKFYSSMLSAFAEHDGAQIWLYSFNEEVVAVDLCIVRNETLVILKTTYDEKFAKFSPSLLMKLDAYEKLGLECKVSKIEYFGKVKDWHRRLKCEERAIYHTTWCKYPFLYKFLRKIKNKITGK